MRTIDNQPEDFLLNGWSLLLGTGLIAAPWALGFQQSAGARGSHVSVGAAPISAARSELWRLSGSPSADEV